METNTVLKEELVKETMLLSRINSIQEVVDLALQHYVAYHKRRSMLDLFGKVNWEGDLKVMREA